MQEAPLDTEILTQQFIAELGAKGVDHVVGDDLVVCNCVVLVNRGDIDADALLADEVGDLSLLWFPHLLLLLLHLRCLLLLLLFCLIITLHLLQGAVSALPTFLFCSVPLKNCSMLKLGRSMLELLRKLSLSLTSGGRGQGVLVEHKQYVKMESENQ